MSVNRRSFLTATSTTAGLAALQPSLFAAEDSAAELKKIGKTPHTKFAVNCEMWWTKLPFMERVKQTAALGFPAIEIWPLAGKDLDALASLTQDLGVEIAQFTAWGFKPGMNDPDKNPTSPGANPKAGNTAAPTASTTGTSSGMSTAPVAGTPKTPEPSPVPGGAAK